VIGTLTVRLALVVGTVPHALLITQSNAPASETFAAAIVRVALVAPGMSEPSLRHWNCASAPEAPTLKVADSPSQTVAGVGSSVTVGVALTVRVATDEDAYPQLLLITHSYAPASDSELDPIAKLGPVAPGMFTPSFCH
jgi:hypothetical protein